MDEPLGSEHCEAPSKKKKMYIMAATIADNDYISSLPGDCLISIFTQLNHAELDILASVSQTFVYFVDRSRPNVVKLRGYDKLEITQTKTGACITLSAKDVRMPAITKFISIDAELSPKKSAEFTLDRIFKFVNAGNIRFDIAEQYFSMDEINDDFLDHCEKWRHKPRMLSFSLRWGSPQNPIYYKRLMKWLTVCGIKHLCLNDLRIADFITSNFLYKLTLSGANPSLCVNTHKNNDQINLDTYTIFPSFSTLSLPQLTVDANLILKLISERYRRNIHGAWVIKCNLLLTSDFVRNLLEPDLIMASASSSDVCKLCEGTPITSSYDDPDFEMNLELSDNYLINYLK
ncbi:hypothetical protein PRIPAC_83162 [Pristionchus pacificus]|uniref:Uncharacterized protein n=1 Tax=Pristionchus pacificus TaxID=54126 RepID=A0A2A6BVC7_PRIPA|nr:hypothetical protein PRIPAC_83162 [Pristionchus pacificus]|eukprot:PDM69711.1 hypothetical protein PRIPAC_44807 [Pristionchus pacificus]